MTRPNFYEHAITIGGILALCEYGVLYQPVVTTVILAILALILYIAVVEFRDAADAWQYVAAQLEADTIIESVGHSKN